MFLCFSADSPDLEQYMMQGGHSANICKMNILLFLSAPPPAAPTQWKSVANIQWGSKMVGEESKLKKRNWQRIKTDHSKKKKWQSKV